VILVVLSAVLALPAAAQASHDLGVTQTPSSTLVKPGQTMTIDSTVSNVGTEAYDNVYVELGSLGGHGKAADDPYLAFSSSQGSCEDQSAEGYGMLYHFLVCSLGPLNPGQTAQIHAVIQFNQTMNHDTTLLPNPYEGGYTDNGNSDNARHDNVFLDVPPKVTGSKKLKLVGLPDSCIKGDFNLTVIAKAANVKKTKLSAGFGYDDEGVGQLFGKSAKGNRLTAKVPASKAAIELDRSWEIKAKARIKGGKKLKTVIEYKRC
jgi:hypothetical protein